MRKYYLYLLLLLCGLMSAVPCVDAQVARKSFARQYIQSGTLPVMYLNTTGGQAITSKDTYLRGDMIMDMTGGLDPQRLGTTAPASLQVKGHGNYTFRGFDKKPYRLKFDEKVGYMGMPVSKHFLLMAGADDDLGFLRNLVGYELSRRLGLAYTTLAKPLELFLNGEYRGLYFLTEKIRVDKTHVNIVEQADGETDPEAVTGGWLVEIDNYDTDPHINVKMGGKNMILTYHTPEVLSDVQERYLQSQWDAIAKALYVDDENSTEWERYIDMESLARVYIARELLQDEEGFHGSCYAYKERGGDTKWTFGPVWDFGNAYQSKTLDRYIFDKPMFTCYVIDRAWKFKRFRDKVKEVWRQFYASEEGYGGLDAYIDTAAGRIADAAKADCERWQGTNVCVTSDEAGKASDFKALLHRKAAWLRGQWGDGGVVPSPGADECNIYVCNESADVAPYVYAWNGTDFGGWPGSQLTASKSIGGRLFYYATIKKGSNVIFSYLPEGTPADQAAGVAQVYQTEDIKNVACDTYYRFYQAADASDRKNGRYEDITSQVATGVSQPSMAAGAGKVSPSARRNLNGQRVDAGYRGIVVADGRKYVQR